MESLVKGNFYHQALKLGLGDIMKGKNVLFSWIGDEDIKAFNALQLSSPPKEDGSHTKNVAYGPVAQLLNSKIFDNVYLLVTEKHNPVAKDYLAWIKSQPGPKPSFKVVETGLKNATDYTEIYNNARKAIDTACEKDGPIETINFHLSPGTKSMASVWVLLGKTYVFNKTAKPATFYQTDLDKSDPGNVVPRCGVVNVPFDIEVDFLNIYQRKIAEYLVPTGIDDKFIASCIEMQEVFDKVARLAAWKDVNVLIEGESGTGKEHIANLIHKNSSRKNKNLIALNCGGLPSNIVESYFFGHVKGAFTGAIRDKKGVFEEADGGTIFLDEIGELRLSDQASLLRVLQEGTVQKVGSSKPIKCYFRVVAATNKNLINEVKKGNFREDLYFRLSTAYIALPSLKQRDDDLVKIAESILNEINKEGQELNLINFKEKKLSVSAMNEIRKYRWPGNIRELQSVLRRAVIFSTKTEIQGKDIKDEIHQSMSLIGDEENDLLPDIEKGPINLKEVVKKVEDYYFAKAYKIFDNKNKTKAAIHLGYRKHQEVTKYMKRWEINHNE